MDRGAVVTLSHTASQRQIHDYRALQRIIAALVSFPWNGQDATLGARMSTAHWLDYAAAVTTIRRRLFTAGFGDTATLEQLLIHSPFEDAPRPVEINWAASPRFEQRMAVRDGTFSSPVAGLPEAARVAHVRQLLPSARRPAAEQPMYVVLAASGDEGFVTRTRLFQPMVEALGIGVLLLENPFYGPRRPPGQKLTAIRTVSEHVLMNFGMIEEGRSLITWLAAEGHTRLGITGFSMGAGMAAIVAARSPRPIASAIFAAGLSPVPVFTRGFLSYSIDFARLGRGAGGKERAREELGRYMAAGDLNRHPVPLCPEAAVIIGAKRDGYVFPDQVQRLHELWKGSEVRWLPTGHAGALMHNAEALRQAAVDAMRRLERATGEVLAASQRAAQPANVHGGF